MSVVEEGHSVTVLVSDCYWNCSRLWYTSTCSLVSKHVSAYGTSYCLSRVSPTAPQNSELWPRTAGMVAIQEFKSWCRSHYNCVVRWHRTPTIVQYVFGSLSLFSTGMQSLERSVLCILYLLSFHLYFVVFLFFTYYIVISFILPIFFLYTENICSFFKVVASSGDVHTTLLVAGGVFHSLWSVLCDLLSGGSVSFCSTQ
jgi:hypothetical protein